MAMDSVRLGLSLRALRRRRQWTQDQLGRRAGLSDSAISRVERGGADRLSVRALSRLADQLGARLTLHVMWQGEDLDRLLDRDHAHLVDGMMRRLETAGWTAIPEVTFRIGPERGSIDIFARHPVDGQLLVVEVKSVVPDIQAMLSSLDRKARLAPSIARDQGWPTGPVARLLVLPEDRTARRRLDVFAATFDRALPARNVEVRRWIKEPRGPIAGVLFLSDLTQAGPRHRVSVRSSSNERGPGRGS